MSLPETITLRRTSSVSSVLNYADEDEDPYINSLWGIHHTLDLLRGHMSQQHLGAIKGVTEDDEMGEDDSTSLPPTYIVVKLAPDIPKSTLLWLIGKMNGNRRDGGAELIVMKQPASAQQGGVYLHVSASKIKFLEVAEKMEVEKMDKHGHLRLFTVEQLEDFLEEGMHVDDLFSMAEKQTIIRHELENIRALTEDNYLPGFPTFALYEGQSILQVCLKYKLIAKVYPLHDHEALKKLSAKWYMGLQQKQPTEEIRAYFGEAIALYFEFLRFYTVSLLVPAALGLLQLLISSETVPFFCVFNVVWVTIVLEVWKKRSNELAFKWGTINMTSLDEPRPNFRGAMGKDAITGRITPQYPRYFTNLKMYCVSFPIVVLCMMGAFCFMLTSFWLEAMVRNMEPPYNNLVALPSIIYSLLVFILNNQYRKLAVFLTEWENHRTQSQFDRHKVTKLVLFEFINNFMSLFYIAFIIQDMDMLRSQLQTQLIINQAANNFQEALLPLALKYYATKMTQIRKRFSSDKATVVNPNPKAIPCGDPLADAWETLPEIHPEDSRLEAAETEGDMEDYEGTYDDYLELFVQFGFVFLFSSVYPIATALAILNNVIEIRADAFKLCKIFQRPMSRKVKDIGAWQRAFEVLGALSILTNCGVLCLSPQMRKRAGSMTEVEWVLVFVFLEHLLLGIRYLLHISIADKPEWVRVALAKRNYETKQALKLERAQKTQKLLTRKFKTVHGPHRH